LLIVSFGYLIKDIVMIYWYLIIISAVKSWFNVFVNHPIFSLIDELCEPLYTFVRSAVPTLSGIDFSPVVILIFLQLIEILFLPRIFNLASIL
ncbi:MAG: YggT family protein, partial [Gammaproteobacteria bacterium]